MRNVRVWTIALLAAGVSATFVSVNSLALDKRWRLVAGSEEACRLTRDFLNVGQRTMPNELQNLLIEKEPRELLHERLPGRRLADFDFDNDGVVDEVYYYESTSRYISGTLFYVRFAPAKPGANRKEDFSDVSIYPCQFDPSVVQSMSCPPLSQGADEAGIAVKMPKLKGEMWFRGRYTYMWPFAYASKTYLLLRPEGPSDDYAAVIEPTGRNKYRSICAFKR